MLVSGIVMGSDLHNTRNDTRSRVIAVVRPGFVYGRDAASL